MTRYLLDTNAISYYVKRSHPALTARMHTVPDTHLFVSTIIEAELRSGLVLLPFAARARLATEEFLRNITIEPWDSRCTEQFASLYAAQRQFGKPLATADALIAAHALSTGSVLVTSDAVFRNVEGLRVEDWTKGPERA